MSLQHSLALALVLGLLAIPAALAGESDRDACENEEDLDVAVAACTRVINDKKETKDNRADAYYNRGYAYTDLEQYAKAIADFNEVLRLIPDDVDAFIERGLAYARQGRFDLAMSDYDRAIRIDPENAESYFQRAVIFANQGNLRAAIDDHTQEIKYDPKEADSYLSRGMAHLYNGSLGDAQADFKAALKQDAKFAYAVIWLDIAERRNRLPSRFKELASKVDAKKWPAPIIRLFRGQGTIADVVAVAEDAHPLDRTFDLCEAHFYGAQWALINDNKSEAVEHFRAAANTCYTTAVEWYASRQELKALGASP
jgi:lipoprotein NlpI